MYSHSVSHDPDLCLKIITALSMSFPYHYLVDGILLYMYGTVQHIQNSSQTGNTQKDWSTGIYDTILSEYRDVNGDRRRVVNRREGRMRGLRGRQQMQESGGEATGAGVGTDMGE